MTRDQAWDLAQEQADQSFTARWVITTTFDPYAKHGGKFGPSFEDVEGYDVTDTRPGAGTIIYRTVIPRPIHSSLDNVRLLVETFEAGNTVKVLADFSSKKLAEAYAAKFPKSVKMQASKWAHDFRVEAQAYLWADQVNKGVNETGIKRIKRILEIAKHYSIVDTNTGEIHHGLADRLGVAGSTIGKPLVQVLDPERGKGGSTDYLFEDWTDD